MPSNAPMTVSEKNDEYHVQMEPLGEIKLLVMTQIGIWLRHGDRWVAVLWKGAGELVGDDQLAPAVGCCLQHN